MKLSSKMLLPVAFVLLACPVRAVSPAIFLTIAEPDRGSWYFTWEGVEYTTVAPGENLDFSWSAEYDVQETVGTISGFRYGWDLVDPYDPYDPGWACEGLADVTAAPTKSFAEGVHTFVVRVEDDQGRETVGQIHITVDAALRRAPTTWGRLKGGYERLR